MHRRTMGPRHMQLQHVAALPQLARGRASQFLRLDGQRRPADSVMVYSHTLGRWLFVDATHDTYFTGDSRTILDITENTNV